MSISDVLKILGAVVFVVALWLAQPLVGMAVLGVVLVFAGWLMERTEQ